MKSSVYNKNVYLLDVYKLIFKSRHFVLMFAEILVISMEYVFPWSSYTFSTI